MHGIYNEIKNINKHNIVEFVKLFCSDILKYYYVFLFNLF